MCPAIAVGKLVIEGCAEIAPPLGAHVGGAQIDMAPIGALLGIAGDDEAMCIAIKIPWIFDMEDDCAAPIIIESRWAKATWIDRAGSGIARASGKREY